MYVTVQIPLKCDSFESKKIWSEQKMLKTKQLSFGFDMSAIHSGINFFGPEIFRVCTDKCEKTRAKFLNLYVVSSVL